MFLFGWLVTAATIYWGYAYPEGLCDNSFGNYMFALLVISFILIPIQFLSTVLRGQEEEIVEVVTDRSNNTPLVKEQRES